MSFSFLRLSLFCLALLACVGASAAEDDLVVYHGASDASAAVMLDAERFAMADDENNVLRIYSLKRPDRPIGFVPLSDFIGIDADHPEADIEGATRIGDRVYWITSHGRNKNGKLRPSRYRLFATTILRKGDSVTLEPAGKPCRDLLGALLADDKYAGLYLQDAIRLDEDVKKKERERLAPKEEGLNIEGLAAGPDGKRLYIALRNPQFVRKGSGGALRNALVITLVNPEEVVDKGVRPLFASPVLLGLGSLGIRSMEYCVAKKIFYVIAGPRSGSSRFALYGWSGKPGEAANLIKELTKVLPPDFGPEALFFPAPDRMILLSDDGTRLIDVSSAGDCVEGEYLKSGKCPNKYLLDDSRKTFRAWSSSL